MKLIKSWKMNRYLSCLFMLLLWGCIDNSYSSKCSFNKAESTDMFFFIDSCFIENDACLYFIQSNFFDKKVFNGRLFKEGSKILVNCTKKNDEYELFFSFDAPIGSKNIIHIYHRNWKEKRAEEIVGKTYIVILEKVIDRLNEKIAVVKLPQIVAGLDHIPTLDVIVFFSSIKGFIGSYYLNPQFPKEIIGKSGNILEDYLNYSGFTFNTLE